MLYEGETVLWRFALPRAGWWRKAQRARLPIRPLSQSQLKREESLKRQAWMQYRSWSRITSGVLLSVIDAVQYGTSKVFYKIVPHFDTEGLRQYIHQVMAIFGHTGKEGYVRDACENRSQGVIVLKNNRLQQCLFMLITTIFRG